MSKPVFLFEAGMAAPTVMVNDANGAELSAGVAPELGAGASWLLSPGLRSITGVRASLATLRGEDDGFTWNAGRTSQVALHIGLEQALGGRFGVSASAGPTWLFGPDDVTPFRGSASSLHWGGSVGTAVRLLRSRPLSATARLDGMMIGGSSAADPIAEPAWSRRVVIGVRYGL